MFIELKETMLGKQLKIVNINKDIEIGKKAKWKWPVTSDWMLCYSFPLPYNSNPQRRWSVLLSNKAANTGTLIMKCSFLKIPSISIRTFW